MTAPHRMLEYVRETPQALEKTLRCQTAVEAIAARAAQRGIQRLIVVGSGSSYTAALIAEPSLTYHGRLPTQVLEPVELAFLAPRLVDSRTMVVAVSRTGSSGHVIQALIDAKERGALAVGMTGNPDSALARHAEFPLFTQEGPEEAFPTTKSVMTCAGLLIRLGLALARKDDTEAVATLGELEAFPAKLSIALPGLEHEVQSAIPWIMAHDQAAVAGTLSNFGAAMEGAMKIQEAAGLPACGYSTDGLLHGAVGTLDARWLVIVLATHNDRDATGDLLRVVRALGAHTMSIVEPDLGSRLDDEPTLDLGFRIDTFIAGLASLTPLHLLSYYLAVARNIDPDSPLGTKTVLRAIRPPVKERADSL